MYYLPPPATSTTFNHYPPLSSQLQQQQHQQAHHLPGKHDRSVQTSDERHRRPQLNKVSGSGSEDDGPITCGENARSFCTSTAMHGLRYVGTVQLSRFERAFFVLVFGGVICLSVYYISNIYSKWTESPVIITLKAMRTSIAEIPFPAVTICNANQARRDEVDKFETGSTDHYLLRTICLPDTNDTSVQSAPSPTGLVWANFKTFLKRMGRPCDELLLSCRYGTMDLNCGDVFTTVLTDEGFCCNFNGVDKPFLLQDYVSDAEDYEYLYSNRSMFGADRHEAIDWTPEEGFGPSDGTTRTFPRRGIGYGTHMGLTVLGSVHAKDYYCTSTNSAGLKVLLHPPNETPKISNFGQHIGVGRENRIVITPNIVDASDQIRKVPIKLRQCVFANEIRMRYFRTYSRKNCEMECESHILIKTCGCVLFYMPRLHANTEICGRERMACAQTMKLAIERVDNHTFTCDCLPGCIQVNYNADVSTAKLGQNFLMPEKILNRLPAAYAAENIVLMHFYYEQGFFRGEMMEELIGFTEFLSNTGGLLGLFMGFSVISIVEIVYFLTIRPYCAIKRIGERRRRRAIYGSQPQQQQQSHSATSVQIQPYDNGIAHRLVDNRAVVTISSGLHRPFRVKFRQTVGGRRGDDVTSHHRLPYPYLN